MSNTSVIMSVKDMIDKAFGDPKVNVVHFKYIQAILLILAKQLRVLERRVSIEVLGMEVTSSESITVTEYKIITRKRPKLNEENKTTAATAISREEDPSVFEKPGDKSATSKSSSSKSKSTTDRTSNKTKSFRKSLQQGPHNLERHSEERERVIRVINQRSDSKTLPNLSPTPMASAESFDSQEKILLVERGSADKDRARSPRLSVVTVEEFEKLWKVVNGIKKQLRPIPTASFPENEQLLEELHKGASLTDAMAALQLSARLEAAEKTLQKLMSLITDVAKFNGIDLEIRLQNQDLPYMLQKITKSIEEDVEVIKAPDQSKVTTQIPTQTKMSEHMASNVQQLGVQEETEEEMKKYITQRELDDAIREFSEDIMKKLQTITSKNTATANSALHTANKLESKLAKSLNLGNRMATLEAQVSAYADQINTLDTGLSSQMTSYQEQLTQMQYDLEVGIDAMSEALANRGGNQEAVAELNSHFTNLQSDIDNTLAKQKELKDMYTQSLLDVDNLKKQIELLRGIKSDREEVEDALRDKAGIADLNGLVSCQQFDAVRGDFEERIGRSYDKFNNQETVWQKAIDELIREINDKADWVQLESLRLDINKHLNNLNGKLNETLKIVGEPRAAAITRKIHRDAACLSCSTPAHMMLEEPTVMTQSSANPPNDWRPTPTATEEQNQPKEDGDHTGAICYPGYPIPHERDPRAHFCRRYCGGSHTRILPGLVRAPLGLTVTRVYKQVTTELGSDGRPYLMDEGMTPCLQCNPEKAKSSRFKTNEDILTGNIKGSETQETDSIVDPPQTVRIISQDDFPEGVTEQERSITETPTMISLYDE